MKKYAGVILALALCPISTIALAQTDASPAAREPTTGAAAAIQNQTNANTASPNQGGSSGGLRMAERAAFAVRFVTVQPADFMASKLLGATVYNNQNESIGEIEDLIVDNGRTISGLVVSVGGFLGMGDSYVVLDPTTVVLSKKDNAWRAFVDTNKDNLKSAPKFKYSKK